MRTGCIAHPANAQMMKVHQWQVDMLDGDTSAAKLMSFFEYWHDVKYAVATLEGKGDDIKRLIQHHTEPELEAGLFADISRKTIRQKQKKLIAIGVLTIEKNPYNQHDRTKHFLFHPDVAQAMADAWAAIYVPHQKLYKARNRICIPGNLTVLAIGNFADTENQALGKIADTKDQAIGSIAVSNRQNGNNGNGSIAVSIRQNSLDPKITSKTSSKTSPKKEERADFSFSTPTASESEVVHPPVQAPEADQIDLIPQSTQSDLPVKAPHPLEDQCSGVNSTEISQADFELLQNGALQNFQMARKAIALDPWILDTEANQDKVRSGYPTRCEFNADFCAFLTADLSKSPYWQDRADEPPAKSGQRRLVDMYAVPAGGARDAERIQMEGLWEKWQGEVAKRQQNESMRAANEELMNRPEAQEFKGATDNYERSSENEAERQRVIAEVKARHGYKSKNAVGASHPTPEKSEKSADRNTPVYPVTEEEGRQLLAAVENFAKSGSTRVEPSEEKCLEALYKRFQEIKDLDSGEVKNWLLAGFEEENPGLIAQFESTFPVNSEGVAGGEKFFEGAGYPGSYPTTYPTTYPDGYPTGYPGSDRAGSGADPQLQLSNHLSAQLSDGIPSGLSGDEFGDGAGHGSEGLELDYSEFGDESTGNEPDYSWMTADLPPLENRQEGVANGSECGNQGTPKKSGEGSKKVRSGEGAVIDRDRLSGKNSGMSSLGSLVPSSLKSKIYVD